MSRTCRLGAGTEGRPRLQPGSFAPLVSRQRTRRSPRSWKVQLVLGPSRPSWSINEATSTSFPTPGRVLTSRCWLVCRLPSSDAFHASRVPICLVPKHTETRCSPAKPSILTDPYIHLHILLGSSPSNMRYNDWDVLLFPGDSIVPIKEFRVDCHLVHDIGEGLAPLSLMRRATDPLPGRVLVLKWIHRPSHHDVLCPQLGRRRPIPDFNPQLEGPSGGQPVHQGLQQTCRVGPVRGTRLYRRLFCCVCGPRLHHGDVSPNRGVVQIRDPRPHGDMAVSDLQ